MTLLEQICANFGKLETLGLKEREAARQAGVSSFYVDPAYGDYIVEEKPSGVKVLTPFSAKPAHPEAAE